MTDTQPLEQAVGSALRELVDLEARVPDEGSFSPHAVSFTNPVPRLYLSRITLTIGAAPSYADKRYLEVLVLTPSGGSSSQWMEYGSKQEIFTKLRDPAMAGRVVDVIADGELDLR